MRTRLWAAALAALTLAGSAQAQVIAMRFGQGGVPFALGTGNFSVSPSGTIAIQIFLTDSDLTFRNEGGIGGAGVGVRSSNTAIANVLTTADVSGNPSFGLAPVIHVNDATVPNGASVSDSGLTGVQPTQGTPSVANPDFLLVGTFTFHAGATPGTTTLSLFDWNLSQTNTRTVNGTSGNLDTRPEMFLDTALLRVVPVPEPSTLALSGLAAAGLAVIRRRRAAAAATAA